MENLPKKREMSAKEADGPSAAGPKNKAHGSKKFNRFNSLIGTSITNPFVLAFGIPAMGRAERAFFLFPVCGTYPPDVCLLARPSKNYGPVRPRRNIPRRILHRCNAHSQMAIYGTQCTATFRKCKHNSKKILAPPPAPGSTLGKLPAMNVYCAAVRWRNIHPSRLDRTRNTGTLSELRPSEAAEWNRLSAGNG